MTVVILGHKPYNERITHRDKELSGAKWARQFLGGTHISDLTGTFRHARTKIAVAVVCFMMAAPALAKDSIPKDVQVFIKNAEACEHLAGEFDGGLSKQRQKEIERGVVRYCQPAQKQLKRLTAKYRNNSKLMETIRSHANESVTSFR